MNTGASTYAGTSVTVSQIPNRKTREPTTHTVAHTHTHTVTHTHIHTVTHTSKIGRAHV